MDRWGQVGTVTPPLGAPFLGYATELARARLDALPFADYADPDPGRLPLDEPECCSMSMIYDNGIAWECQDAYFTLVDDGAIDPCGWSPPRLRRPDDASPEHRALLAHLLSTRVLDES